MIYLTKTKGDKAAITRAAKMMGIAPEALYDNIEDRILLISPGGSPKNMVNILNHEFMHRILYKSSLKRACYKWDNEFALLKVEAWLGWRFSLPFEYESRKACRRVENFLRRNGIASFKVRA